MRGPLSTFYFNPYSCHECKTSGVKLWRWYQSCNIRLYCAECAKVSQGKDYEVLEDGTHFDEGMGYTDSIGWLVPAIPTEQDPEAYWGYTSVPDHLVEWWAKLPNEAGITK